MRNIIALFSIRNPPGMPEDGWRQAREWAIWEVAPGRYSHLCFIHSFPKDATRDDMLHYVYGMVYHTLRMEVVEYMWEGGEAVRGPTLKEWWAVGSEYRARFNADTKKMYPDEEAHGFV
jgi:hypothetical protein